MRNLGFVFVSMGIALGQVITGCSSQNSTASTPATKTYVLTVNSVNLVAVGVKPADISGASDGGTNFARTYNSGTSVTLTAPSTSSGNVWSSWTGCTSVSGLSCTVVLGADTTVAINYVPPAVYTLTVNSASPASGVQIGAAPFDNNNKSGGTTGFALLYNAGTTVALSAPVASGGFNFVSWTGCTTVVSLTCNVTVNANASVTALYDQPFVHSVSVTPNQAVTIGVAQQFSATVVGTGSYSSAVSWALTGPAGYTLGLGNLTTGGLYTAPYPAAPASVTITATSVEDTTKSGSATLSLNVPATSAGPALTVDAGNQTRSINPYIYGMNSYALSPSVAKAANIPVDRFGGDVTSGYNYLLDVTSDGNDYYFENVVGTTGLEDSSQFNTQVASDAALGAKTMGTVGLLGWVSKDGTSCSFPKSLYPTQQQMDAARNCGNGLLADGTPITGNDPSATSVAAGPSFAGGWVKYLVGKFGNAASGGVAIYGLDNEPAWWDYVHRDVHPVASTYDEVTNSGIATAQAVKAADPTAQVTGPVVDNWWNYFYSKQDMESGWGQGPCYQPWAKPTDRKAHGGVPFVEYYLQQFAAKEAANQVRLLDYLDLHTYFAATYLGSSVAFGTAGDTGEQEARLDSTRAFWDPTYTDTDPTRFQPNYPTDANYYTANCSIPAQSPQLIPMMHTWIAKDYPGTKTAITEYNWGGLEAMNGALAQADILGIFGSYGLDLGTLWGPPDPTTQIPGLQAFMIYRNYDGNNSEFGDRALASTSEKQGALSVYGAFRTSDNAKTIVVINKTYGDLTSTLSLGHLTAGANETAKVYLYSNAKLAGIVAQPAIPVSPPTGSGTTSTIAATFPAQSITLFIVP